MEWNQQGYSAHLRAVFHTSRSLPYFACSHTLRPSALPAQTQETYNASYIIETYWLYTTIAMMCSLCEDFAKAKGFCRLHYDRSRDLLPCRQCSKRRYKAQLCRAHYRAKQLCVPHCTYPRCFRKLFFKMHCQYHYRAVRTTCLNCGFLGTYCRSLCRTCYDSQDRAGDGKTCTECHRLVYMDRVCVVHFRRLKITQTCSLCNRERVHKDRCKIHIL